MAEKKRREEEEGKYEVGKVLEVKFPKGKPREFLIRWKGHGEEMDSWEPENNLDCSDLIQRSVFLTVKKKLVIFCCLWLEALDMRDIIKKIIILNKKSNLIKLRL